MDQSKALLSALLTKHVIEFIDFRKLAFSSVMRDLTTQAALHAIQHGDISYIDKILDIFKNTRYALQMASWFSFRTGLDIQETLGQRSYRRSGMPPKPQVQLHDFLNAKPARQTNVAKPANKASQTTITTKKAKKIRQARRHARQLGPTAGQFWIG
ncbi:hypothetical protein TOC8171_46970 [Pseudomonas syringae]